MQERILDQAKKVLEIESKAVIDCVRFLNADFVKAAEWIFQCKGKLVVSGIGKSGQIARKLASTFSSTGTPAIYLHPAESSHGDLGIVSESDVILALSYGGESYELNSIMAFAARKGIRLIAMTGNLNSSLAKAAQAVIQVHVDKEACPLNLAPTASTTATLAMGDALAMSVLMLKGFTTEDFAAYHPGGSLGFKLLTRVKDLMHVGDGLPLVNLDTEIRAVLSIMTHRDVRGCAGVVDAHGDLTGVVTDGDIRRRLEKNQNPLDGKAKDLMTLNPRTIDASELAEKALFMMEEFRIQMLFVLDRHSATPKKPIGLLHLQDLIKAKIK
ncbi:MAG: KpsF/GutQ family sugar-phosphate isomerase [Bdellovibrionaceae bacterium]|nr:KpsF/GutQ family sugar-phosphate isomerase [Pseudobdellovibrionaceae bacterium]